MRDTAQYEAEKYVKCEGRSVKHVEKVRTQVRSFRSHFYLFHVGNRPIESFLLPRTQPRHKLFPSKRKNEKFHAFYLL